MSIANDPLAPRSNEGVVLSDERVELALRAFKEGARKSQVKALLKMQFGLAPRTCEPIMTEAKRRWIAEVAADPEAYKAESALVYHSIREDISELTRKKADPQATAKERYFHNKARIEAARVEIMAQQRIDKLLGFEAPEQHEHRGAVVQFSLSDVMRAAQRAEAELGQVIDVRQIEEKE